MALKRSGSSPFNLAMSSLFIGTDPFPIMGLMACPGITLTRKAVVMRGTPASMTVTVMDDQRDACDGTDYFLRIVPFVFHDTPSLVVRLQSAPPISLYHKGG